MIMTPAKENKGTIRLGLIKNFLNTSKEDLDTV